MVLKKSDLYSSLWRSCDELRGGMDASQYIVVHEMTHLLERNHGERFTKLMDKFMPDWRARRDRLNGAPLAEEKWT